MDVVVLRKSVGWGWNFLKWGVGLYWVGVLGIALLQALDSTPAPWLILGEIFLPVLFLAALGAGGVWILYRGVQCLSRRKWVPLDGVLLVVGLVFSVLYGPSFVPRETQPDPDALKVMTFNLGPIVSDSEKVLATIEAASPDILMVQELTLPMQVKLEERLGERYPYRVFELDTEWIGLLSRYPIRDHGWIEEEVPGRPTLWAEVDWNGQPLQLLGIHPWVAGIQWFPGTRIPIGVDDREPQVLLRATARRAAAMVAAGKGPLIVLGDCNQTDSSAAYREMTTVLQDAYREAGMGFGFSFPNLRVRSLRLSMPLIRIDYIFHSAELRAQRAEVGCESTSDHCYVMAWLVSERP